MAYGALEIPQEVAGELGSSRSYGIGFFTASIDFLGGLGGINAGGVRFWPRNCGQRAVLRYPEVSDEY